MATVTPSSRLATWLSRVPVGPTTILSVVLFVALEVGLREAGYGTTPMTEKSARYGWVLLPDQDRSSRDGRHAERINAAGFRDREWEPPPAADRVDTVTRADAERPFRVVVLGNSMTYGTSVAVEDTWPRQLEGLLADTLAARGIERPVRVMNFAVQGYRLEQMARVFEDLAGAYRPDLVLVGCHRADAAPMPPFQDEPDWAFRRLVQRTACYDLLSRHVMDRWIPPTRRARPRLEDGPLAGRALDEVERAMLERPFSREFEPLWREAVKRMAELGARVEDDGGRLVLVCLPRYRRHFEPGLRDSASIWVPAARRHPGWTVVEPWPRFEREMRAFVASCAEHDVDAASTHDLSTLTWTDDTGARRPADELPGASSSLHLPRDTGHYSPAGHRVLAEEVLAALLGARLLPGDDLAPGGVAPDGPASEGTNPGGPPFDLADPQLLERLPLRWHARLPERRDEVLAETAWLLEAGAEGELAEVALYWRVQCAGATEDLQATAAAIVDYSDRFPDSAKVPRMLDLLAQRARVARPDLAREAWRALLASHPAAPEARLAPGRLRQLDDVGRPFTLDPDAMDGDVVAADADAHPDDPWNADPRLSAGFRGRYVVVHFERPGTPEDDEAAERLRALRDGRHADRIAFLAVRPHGPAPTTPGPDAPALHEPPGDPWSAAWGVGETPWVFLVDPAGSLSWSGPVEQLEARLTERLGPARDGPAPRSPDPRR